MPKYFNCDLSKKSFRTIGIGNYLMRIITFQIIGCYVRSYNDLELKINFF